MNESTDPGIAWPRILETLSSRNLEALKMLLWPPGASEDWPAAAKVWP